MGTAAIVGTVIATVIATVIGTAATAGDAIVRAGKVAETPAVQLSEPNDRLVESRAKTTPLVRNPRRATIPQTDRAAAVVVGAGAAEAMVRGTRNLNRRAKNESPSCCL